MNNEAVIVEVKVTYKGMYRKLWMDISEYNNEDHYLEIIKDHVNIAKHIIDKKNTKSD